MGINSKKKIELIPVRLNDVDLFSEWETGLGWDIESTQLSAGANRITFDHFALPEMLVGRFTAKESMQNVFSIPHGMVMFLITREKLPALWNGQQFPPSLMAVVRAGIEHWVVLPDGWDCYEFMVAEELIWRTELFPLSFYAETSQLQRAFLPLMEPVTTQFLQLMDSYFNHVKGVNSSSAAAVHGIQFYDAILQGLFQVFDAGLKARGSFKPRPTRRPDLIKKAHAFISQHLTIDFSIDDMAQALDISSRVLNYAFKDSLGISPSQYIQTQKLHAVRRLLRSSDVSVTEACIAHGFHTPSRFSRQYARLFGELPSLTRYPNRTRAA